MHIKKLKNLRTILLRRTKVLKIEILGWGFYLEISLGSPNKTPTRWGFLRGSPVLEKELQPLLQRGMTLF